MIEIRRGTEQANYRAMQHHDCTVVITKDTLERISAGGLCAFGLAGLVGTWVLCMTIDLVGPLVTLLPFSIVVGWIGAVGFFNRTEIHRHNDAWVVWNGPFPNPLEKQRRRFLRVPGERIFSEERRSSATTSDGRVQSTLTAVVILAAPGQAERILFSTPRPQDAARITEALRDGL